MPLRARHDGWTPIRQGTFLQGLTDTGCVKQACARAGLSKTSAYRLRDRSPEFAAAWDKALSIVAPILEHAAFERAVEGWEEPVFYAGKVCGSKRRYSDAMLRVLLERRKAAAPVPHEDMLPALDAPQHELEAYAARASARAGGSFTTRMSSAAVDAELTRRLDALAAVQQKAREKAHERAGLAIAHNHIGVPDDPDSAVVDRSED